MPSKTTHGQSSALYGTPDYEDTVGEVSCVSSYRRYIEHVSDHSLSSHAHVSVIRERFAAGHNGKAGVPEPDASVLSVPTP